MEIENYKKKEFSGLDIFKFIASIMIVTIHVPPFPHVSYLLLVIDTLAVPFFAISSSFLLFRKEPDENQIKKFIIRLIILYLFWVIILFPFIFMEKQYFHNESIINGIKYFLFDLCFQNVFHGAWFFIWLIYTILIVFALKKIFNSKIILLISITIFLYFKFAAINVIPSPYNYIFTLWEQNIGHYFMGLPYIMVFVSIGMLLSQYNLQLKRYKNAIFLFFICFSLMLVSAKILPSYTSILLIPLVPFILIISINLNFQNKILCKRLRSMSIIIFCSHSTIAYHILNNLDLNNPIRFILTLLFSISLSEIIFWLQKYKYLNWIKYSY